MDQHPHERPLTSVEVAGVIYDSAKIREHREKIIVLRDGALEQTDTQWAVILSHNVALLDHFANLLEPRQ